MRPSFRPKQLYAVVTLQASISCGAYFYYLLFSVSTRTIALQGDLILETDKLIEFVIKLTLYANKMDKVEINSSGT